jgi:hypothetical protein
VQRVQQAIALKPLKLDAVLDRLGGLVGPIEAADSACLLLDLYARIMGEAEVVLISRLVDPDEDRPALHQPPDGLLGDPPPGFVPLRPVARLRLDRDFRPVQRAPCGHRQATRVQGPTRVWPIPVH